MAEFAPIIQLSALNGVNGFQINGEGAGDRSGWSVANAGDVNGDGFGDLILGAPQTYSSAPGRSYVVFGKASGFAAIVNLSALNGTDAFQLDGVGANDSSGYSVAGAGDVNGDGFDDVIVGARQISGTFGYAVGPGASFVVFGKASGFDSTIALSTLDGANGFRLNGAAFWDLTGQSVASAGDVNGDSIGDLIVGAPGADPDGSRSGASYVVFGRSPASGGFAASIDLSTLNGTNGFRLDGLANEDLSGHSAASAGDVNGDGFADVIVGAFAANPTGLTDAGASYVVFGKASGFAASIAFSALDGTNGFRLDGVTEGNRSGYSVASAGDVNGDGFADVIVGGPQTYNPGSGTSYVVFGNASGFAATINLSTLNGTNGFRLDGVAIGDQSGRRVAGAGDVNGDGFADLIIASHVASPGGRSAAGSSYVVFGKASGFAAAINLSTLSGSNGFRLDGVADSDVAGISVSSAGDVNDDGFADLIVGAGLADPQGNQSGASYVIFGHRAFDAVTRTGTNIGQTINGGMGDDRIGALGGNDTLIGWEGVDTLRGGLGNDVYVLDDVNGSGPVLEFDAAIEAAGAGIDTVLIASLDNLPGMDGYGLRANVERGTITGARAFDLAGNGLDNLLTGNGASNALRGLDGNDTLNGGLGNDTLTGGLGADALDGGAGRDVFDYNAIAESGLGATRDRIAGFMHLVDVIDLAAIDAIAGGADDGFVFRGDKPFTAPGQIRLVQSGPYTIVQLNTVGASGAEAAILLAGGTASTITAADFVL